MQMVEIMFEKLNVPCCFVIKSGVLSAFSCGKSTCLVLDSGHNHTSAIPVHDGYILHKSLLRVDYGGSSLNQNIMDGLLNSQ
jgi:actin-related protein